jgi:hypothetical protein
MLWSSKGMVNSFADGILSGVIKVSQRIRARRKEKSLSPQFFKNSRFRNLFMLLVNG